MATLACARSDCPLVESGTCLDGIDPPSSCPNFQSVEGEFAGLVSASSSDVGSLEEQVESVDELGSERPTDSAFFFGGDAALTLSEADELAGGDPCRVVLIAGEFESGKSTLAIELYAQFLLGSYEGWRFAGSKTLVAFDELHRFARLSSGRDDATTERTRHEDMRLLHLALEHEAVTTHFLISDVKGEFFEHVIDGAAVAVEVPIASRADICFFLVNGERLSDTSTRDLELFRANQLLQGLCAPGGLRKEARIAIVCSKRDTLPARISEEIRTEFEALLELCSTKGMVASYLELSARPVDGSAPSGLGECLQFAQPRPRNNTTIEIQRRPGERRFWAAQVLVP